ncbi:hydrolase [Actinotalea ferrariae CF5-4]|uniref:Hydrolase n=1 Tax=Actinotalea ferrariae CF5-4 TaxID=948458 RepID=A0A021VZX5_9CELL|nr:HAD family phosphatase [Actinotalea ferrariae]EYR64622.1 hydrolase [Actinotalea ferrariae CF5-4]
MPPAPPAPATPDDAGTPALPLPAAVLWDMDGTLVDTEPCWMAAERELVRRHGGTWGQEDAEAIVGMPLTVGAARLQAAGVDLPVPEIVERMLDHVIATLDDHADWQPGALDLLVALQEAGVPCALVTMSYRRLAEAVLQQAPAGAFTVLVTGDEVTHGKPHPEPFLAAAAALGVDVTACVAIEDSPPGIGSALASGARTLGVQHIVPVEPRPGLSRVASLADVSLADLARLRAGEVFDRLAPASDAATGR